MDTSVKNRYWALLFTVIFHALLLLVFIYTIFKTPIPPFPITAVPEIEIGLGMEGAGTTPSGGSGQHDEEIAPKEKALTSTTPVKANDAGNTVTDETETEVSVKKNPKNQNEKETEKVKVEEEKASKELLEALAVLKSNPKHAGNGAGTGNTGGSGNGDKQGLGDGPGNGFGNDRPGGNGGNGYDLSGRRLVRKPDRMTDSQEEGIVVVEIIVDETGKVIKATPGQRGSTTTSSNLYAKARQAALSVKFNPSDKGIKEQRGSYTFVFNFE